MSIITSFGRNDFFKKINYWVLLANIGLYNLKSKIMWLEKNKSKIIWLKLYQF